MKRLTPLLALAAAALLAAFAFPASTTYAAVIQPYTDSLRTEADRARPRRPVVRRLAFAVDTGGVPDCVAAVKPFTDTLRFEIQRPQSVRVTVVRRMAAKIDTAAAACGSVGTPAATPRTLARSVASLTFAGDSAGTEPDSQAVALTNSAGSASIANLAVTWTHPSDSGWLVATLSATSTPATLYVDAAQGARAPGTYTATVSVSGDSVTTVDIPVTFTVGAAPAPPDTTTPPNPTQPGGTLHAAELPQSVPSIPSAVLARACTVTLSPPASIVNALVPNAVICLSAANWPPLNLPPRTAGDTSWIVIRSASGAATFASGARARPSVIGSTWARILGDATTPAVRIRGRKYVLTNLELSAITGISIINTILDVGLSGATSAASQPDSIGIVANWIHGTSSLPVQRCVLLSSAATVVADNWIDDCHGKGFDTQAIAGWNGPGPYLIENNYLAGAGENVMFGGAIPPTVGVVTSDVTIRRNHIITPATWKGVWTKKNLFELKNARRVLLEANVLDGSWTDGQTGFGIMLYSANQGNGACTWCRVTDVAMRDNLILNVSGGINISGKQTTVDTSTRRIAFVSNVIDSAKYSLGVGKLIQVLPNTGRDLTIDSVVAVGGGYPINSFLTVDPNSTWTNFTFSNVVSQFGTYGMFCSRYAGEACGAIFSGTVTFSGNEIIGTSRSGYPNATFRASESLSPLATAIRARVAAATAGVVVLP